MLKPSHAALVTAALTVAYLPAFAADEPLSFNRDVRPILSDKCFACHGPDANQREADLRLDHEEGAKDSAIVAGKPDESELLRRLTTDDPDERMPPGSTGKAVSDAQLETLRRWIAQGAKWEQHWSLIRPERPAIPNAGGADGETTNDIDRFILSTLRRNGLQPSPLADRRTLLRRLSFDLTGLPPTVAEVQAFETDKSPDAYQKVVDRLFQSRHFGERMAMYWLDVVRYADTGGYHSDNHRDVSRYRDYVINAFNDNLPFDEFTLEQLAGDLLPEATNWQKIASGYNRLLQTTQEGGAQPKEYTAKYQADRVRNTAAAWLGVTMGCAECHDHKFDPFTMKDFYSLGAFFADVEEIAVGNQKQVALPTEEQSAQLKSLDEQLAGLRSAYNESTPEYVAARDAWTVSAAKTVLNQSDWQVAKPEALKSVGGQTLNLQDDLSVLASGTNPAKDTYEITLRPAESTLTALRLEALKHDSLAKKSLSRGNGNFVLTSVEVEVRPAEGEPRPVKLQAATADFSQDNWPVANTLDGKPNTGWAVDGHNKPANHKAVFVFAKPLKMPADATLLVRLRHDSAHPNHSIGRFRLAVTTAAKPGLSDNDGLPEAVVAALKVASAKRNEAQNKAIDDHYRTVAPALAELRQQIAAAEAQQAAIRKAFPQTLISVSVKPRMVRILPRGNWLDDSGEVVAPATPGILPPTSIEDRQRARLDLAKWMVSRDNPLTARVFVNRLWKLYFGQGIVKSLDDFGTQGQWPTHPALLDWLAVDFMESGWDVQRMIKLMVTSRTYQQSSYVTAELKEQDPTNKWLARQGRFRLDAEMVRDNALSVGGLLSRQIGGPSVKPYQPAGYWQHLNFPKRKWQHDKGPSLYRRGLYTYWQRTFLHPSLLAFDAPSREECTVERPRSNTPLQALVLLNDPTYVEAARAFAARIVKEGGETETQRLNFAFATALNRPATAGESEILLALYRKHLEQYKSEPQAVEALKSVGESTAPSDLDGSELAAWMSVARVILNLHETITRY